MNTKEVLSPVRSACRQGAGTCSQVWQKAAESQQHLLTEPFLSVKRKMKAARSMVRLLHPVIQRIRCLPSFLNLQ